MPVEGVVSFHGGLRRDDMYEVKTIKPKVLVLHGADDVYVTQQDILAFQEEMRKSGADWQMNYYSGAGMPLRILLPAQISQPALHITKRQIRNPGMTL
jgi:dienelactone hydrolase